MSTLETTTTLSAEDLRKEVRKEYNDISLWTGRIAGGLPEADLIETVNAAGLSHPIATHLSDILPLKQISVEK